MTAAEPLVDDVFELDFEDALRLHRRVEVLQEFLVEKEKKENEEESSSDETENDGEPGKPKMVIKQRWIEVKRDKNGRLGRLEMPL